MCRCGTRKTMRHVPNNTLRCPSDSGWRLRGRGWPLRKYGVQSRGNHSRGCRLCHYQQCFTTLVVIYSGSPCETASTARPCDQTGLVLSWAPCSLIVYLVFYTFCRVWKPNVWEHSIFSHFHVTLRKMWYIYAFFIPTYAFITWFNFYKWRKCLLRTKFANALVNVFKLCGICWYVM